eukprot:4943439-Pyramimonas_sp.AAC.1
MVAGDEPLGEWLEIVQGTVFFQGSVYTKAFLPSPGDPGIPYKGQTEYSVVTVLQTRATLQ